MFFVFAKSGSSEGPKMKTFLVIVACFSIANPAIPKPLIPKACSSYADSFYRVVDQAKRFNGMALTYPGHEVEHNRLRYYQQMNKNLAPLISCLDDHKSEVAGYYREVKKMTKIQIDSSQ